MTSVPASDDVELAPQEPEDRAAEPETVATEATPISSRAASDHRDDSEVDVIEDPVEADEADGADERPVGTDESLSDDEPIEPEQDSDESGDAARAVKPERERGVVPLAILALLLLFVVVAEGIYVATEPEPARAISAKRPVVLDELSAQGVVDQAAAAVVTIVSGSGKTFDEDLDRATALMTSEFADSYRETKEDVRERWLAEQVQVTAQVSAQGVVRADSDRVEALLFLTQATTKGNGGPTLVQYRVVATMVDTDDGWLVSQLQTF